MSHAQIPENVKSKIRQLPRKRQLELQNELALYCMELRLRPGEPDRLTIDLVAARKYLDRLKHSILWREFWRGLLKK